MKYWFPLLTLICLVGCDNAKHVTGPEFQREYELRNAQTMVASEYLGEQDGKVYLVRKTMSLVSKDKWNEEIWYTEADNLDSTFLQILKNDENPNHGLESTSAPPAAGTLETHP